VRYRKSPASSGKASTSIHADLSREGMVRESMAPAARAHKKGKMQKAYWAETNARKPTKLSAERTVNGAARRNTCDADLSPMATHAP
jgi:hypothetical protein